MRRRRRRSGVREVDVDDEDFRARRSTKFDDSHDKTCKLPFRLLV